MRAGETSHVSILSVIRASLLGKAPYHNHILQYQEKNSKRWTMSTTLLQGLAHRYPLDILISHRFNQKLQSADANDKIVGPWFKKIKLMKGITELCTMNFKPYQTNDNAVNGVCHHRVANKQHYTCICSDIMYYFVDVKMLPLGTCAILFFVS